MTVQYEWTEPDLDSARALLDAATAADGVEPLSEGFVTGLSDPRVGHRHLLARDDGRLVGLAAVSPDDAELVVAPESRRQGIGAALVRAVREDNPQAGVWAHGNLDPAQALARSLELEAGRRLLVMRVDGRSLDDASKQTPDGYEVLSLAEAAERWGRERAEEAWLEANNDAFSWHPEQGGWDLDRLHRAQEASWYSDDDVLMIWDVSGSEPSLAGFHWTKWQADDHSEGEVYVVGLAGDYRGKGLGGPVVEIGLAHLHDGGAREVILYVEDDNEAAVRRYEKLGFVVAEEHVVYG